MWAVISARFNVFCCCFFLFFFYFFPTPIIRILCQVVRVSSRGWFNVQLDGSETIIAARTPFMALVSRNGRSYSTPPNSCHPVDADGRPPTPIHTSEASCSSSPSGGDEHTPDDPVVPKFNGARAVHALLVKRPPPPHPQLPARSAPVIGAPSVKRSRPGYAPEPVSGLHDEEDALLEAFERDLPPRKLPSGVGRFVVRAARAINSELTCPICLGILRSTVNMYHN